MSSPLRRTFAAATLVASTALVTSAVVARPQEGGQPELDPALMAKMMELALPGSQHAELMKGAGTWKTRYEMRMAPDAPWTEFEGEMVARPVLDGRYLVQETAFSMLGMPMKGMMILGYDNSTGEHTSLWADTMSTWWVSARGQADADGTIEYKGSMKDVAGERPFRMVVRKGDDDQVRINMFDTIPPHGDVEVMRILSTRR